MDKKLEQNNSTLSLSALTEEQIQESLRRINLHDGRFLSLSQPDGISSTPAGVLMPLFFENQEWNLLFTRRTDTVRDHKGQVSFPGGAHEFQDPDIISTALREVNEEIGINPEEVRVLGCLPPLNTITHYQITPVVGVIPWPVTFQIEPAEVSRVFTIPLKWLADPDNREEKWDTRFSPPETRKIIYFRPYQNEILWGITGTMVVNFLHLLNIQ